MTRARDIANLVDANGDIVVGALDNVPASNDASALTTGTIPIARLSAGTITADKFATNAVSSSTIGTFTTQKFVYTNVSPNQQPISSTFTLSEAEAPLGSFVNMRCEILSGSAAGDQYCYLEQQGGTGILWNGYVTDWYYYSRNHTLYPIIDAGDRTFNVVHGTIAHSSSGDYRRVLYCGYLKIDGMGD